MSFMKRFGLFLRRKTTAVHKDPEHLIDKIVSYVIQVRGVSQKFLYQFFDTIAMNETAVWPDMVTETTIEKTGRKKIALKSTGHERVRVSVCLATLANLKKWKPFIVFAATKRVTMRSEVFAKCNHERRPNARLA